MRNSCKLIVMYFINRNWLLLEEVFSQYLTKKWMALHTWNQYKKRKVNDAVNLIEPLNFSAHQGLYDKCTIEMENFPGMGIDWQYRHRKVSADILPLKKFKLSSSISPHSRCRNVWKTPFLPVLLGFLSISCPFISS